MMRLAVFILMSSVSWCLDAAEYLPQGHEQFVFSELPKENQSYGYEKFCASPQPCWKPLEYKKYLGVKGYFTTANPVSKDDIGEYWPVILETGEEYFYWGRVDGNRYGLGPPIISLEQSKHPDFIAQGSNIYIVSSLDSWNGVTHTLSNGLSVNAEKLERIRKIAAYYSVNVPRLAELLLKFDIQEDEIERQFFIQPKDSILGNQARLYIGVNKKQQWLRMKIQYSGDDWLFVSSYKIAADDYRWQSGNVRFERDHSSGTVWEWVDKSPSKQELSNLKALSKAQNSTIRFQGNQYYSDFKLTSIQQEAIKDIIELFDEMRNAKRKR